VATLPPGAYRLSGAEIDQLVRAVLDFTKWVNRRVETKTFVDDVRVSHHTSLDFTIPPVDLPRSDTNADVCLVPLLFLRKATLRTFDLRDEEGKAQPALTRDQNARIAPQCLTALYVLACERATPRLVPDQDVAGRLEQVVRLDPPASLNVLDQLTGETDGVAPEQTAAIRNYAPLMALLVDFATGFLLLTQLAAKPRDRRVIKLTYVQTLRPTSRTPGLFPRSMLALGQWIGWLDHGFTLTASGIGAAQSYHFEMGMPSDIIVRSARLVRVQPAPALLAIDTSVILTHLNCAGQTRGAIASVDCEYRLRPSMLWPGYLISAATFLLLAGGVLLRLAGFHARLDPASAFLLTLPALFAAYSLATEHPLTRRIAAGTRASAIGAAVLSLVAAASMVVTAPNQVVVGAALGGGGVPDQWRLALWVVLGLLGLVNFVIAAGALLISGLAEREMK
jgi:hypothetical protein